MTAEDEVLAASEKFYAALNRLVNGDAGPLAEIWSHGAAVTTMHPIGGREVGWEQVRNSWEQVARISADGRVRLDDRYVRVVGDAAYELGVERGRFSLGGQPVTLDVRVTNIHRRESGAWKIVHHHTDRAPEMIESLNQLIGRPRQRDTGRPVRP